MAHVSATYEYIIFRVVEMSKMSKLCTRSVGWDGAPQMNSVALECRLSHVFRHIGVKYRNEQMISAELNYFPVKYE